MLSCPVWQQHHTKALTYCGRNRAAIGGAGEEELAASAKACILCGSCEPLCPMGIRTLRATLRLRQNLSGKGLMPAFSLSSKSVPAKTKPSSHLLLAGRALMETPEIAKRCTELLGLEIYHHDGQ